METTTVFTWISAKHQSFFPRNTRFSIKPLHLFIFKKKTPLFPKRFISYLWISLLSSNFLPQIILFAIPCLTLLSNTGRSFLFSHTSIYKMCHLTLISVKSCNIINVFCLLWNRFIPNLCLLFIEGLWCIIFFTMQYILKAIFDHKPRIKKQFHKTVMVLQY